MIIRWFGQCSFLLQDSFGRRILTDPLDITPIDTLLELNPKLITISHNHIDVLSQKLEHNSCSIITTSGNYNLNYCKIEGLETYHDKSSGIKRGGNTIYKIQFDNLNLVHLGHLGHIPNSSTLTKLKNIDILFIPIGGHFTLNGIEAAILTNLLKPKAIIPMYYRNCSSLSYLDSPKNFLTSMKYITNLKNDILDTTKISLDGSVHNQILLLKESSFNSISKKTV